MNKKKMLITGANGMLAHDFIRTQKEKFTIIALEKKECDICEFPSCLNALVTYEPDIVLNLAAYTAVDDAEDIGRKQNIDINTLGVYNLAKATSALGIPIITISSDYVFDGTKSDWYLPNNSTNPINNYGTAKYLGEMLALRENSQSIVVRTSWLYGGDPWNKAWNGKIFKNFINTILRLSEEKEEIKVVNDQFGIPTSCRALSEALWELIEQIDDFLYRDERILHFTNSTDHAISWYEFAQEIITITQSSVHIEPCTSSEYPTKAKRPTMSLLRNNSDIQLEDWRESLEWYLNNYS